MAFNDDGVRGGEGSGGAEVLGTCGDLPIFDMLFEEDAED